MFGYVAQDPVNFTDAGGTGPIGCGVGGSALAAGFTYTNHLLYQMALSKLMSNYNSSLKSLIGSKTGDVCKDAGIDEKIAQLKLDNIGKIKQLTGEYAPPDLVPETLTAVGCALGWVLSPI